MKKRTDRQLTLNAPVRNTILKTLSQVKNPLRASEIRALSPELQLLTPQKIVGVLIQMKNNGMVKMTDTIDGKTGDLFYVYQIA